jgi:hypothetical protein
MSLFRLARVFCREFLFGRFMPAGALVHAEADAIIGRQTGR